MRLKFVLAISVLAVLHVVGMTQTVDIVFVVNMSHQVTLGQFDPERQFVDIAGDFNGWNGQNHRLMDDDKDEIYELVISGFTPGTNIEFKFRIDGVWDGREEFPNGGANRSYAVQQSDNRVEVWYNDQVPPGEGFNIALGATATSLGQDGIVQFFNQTSGDFDETSWVFENGSPDISTDLNPRVRYSQVGDHDVMLIVTDSEVSDTIQFNDFISVDPRDAEEIEWWNEAVFYEIFVRSFKDSDGDGIGDFQGIIDQLDYLNDGDPNTSDDLGITGIWLMPIHPSPSYHGYDVIDYREINADYGNLDDFKRFVDEAHRRGIRVIIDYVLNHTSTDHEWFVESSSGPSSQLRDYYRWRASNPQQIGPWGQDVWHQHASGYYYGLFWSGMPDLNYEDERVQNEMFDIANFWLNDIGIDGFRLDAVKYIREDGGVIEDNPATFQFWKAYQSELKSISESVFSVGEAWTSTDKILDYVEEGGLDICFEFDLASAIINGINSTDAISIQNKIQNVYNVYPNIQFGTFLSNHDQNRVIESFNGSTEKMKTAAAIYLTLPGTPFIYYGEEIGMNGVKPDEFIRTPMQWTNDANAGFSSGLPWIAINSNYSDFNVQTMKSDASSLWHWYDKLLDTRNRYKPLTIGDFSPIYSSDKRILAYERLHNDESLFILINLSDAPISVSDLDVSFTSLIPGEYEMEDILNGGNMQIEVNAESRIQSLILGQRQVIILSSKIS